MQDTDIMSQDEFIDGRSQVMASWQRHQLEGHSDAGCELQKSLDPSGEQFLFQCTCGVKHQFEYMEDATGVRSLTVKK